VFQSQIQDDVFLQLLEERHAPEVFRLVDRERAYLREWLPWVDSTTAVEHTRDFIKTSLEQFAADEGLAAGIWCGDEFAGTVGTHKINWPNRKVEIGYWIASKFQGLGIVTSACRSLIDHVFEQWDLNRVEIHCATTNKKSCSVAERLGFQLEGVLREAQLVGPRYLDLNVYAMLAREWKLRSR
jgi:ribosomal-protein-serine acetyltransferase